MLRLSLAVMSLGAAVAIFSCGNARLGGGTSDGGVDAPACPGRMLPSTCYRSCDGTFVTPQAETCPAGYTYRAAYCAIGALDGAGPVPNTCGDDGGTDARDAGPDAAPACPGTMLPSSCYRSCDGTFVTPQAGTCPAGYTYRAAYCAIGALDGAGPVPNTCGDDGGTDARDAAPDACSGTWVPALCQGTCNGQITFMRDPDGGVCPEPYGYKPGYCLPLGVHTDGWGPPLPNTCPTDAAAGGTGGAAGGGAGNNGAAGGSGTGGT